MKIAVLSFNLLSSVKSLILLTVLVLLGTGVGYSQTTAYGVSIHSKNTIDNSDRALGPPNNTFAKMKENDGSFVIIDLGGVAAMGSEIIFRIARENKNDKTGTVDAAVSPEDFPTENIMTVTTEVKNDDYSEVSFTVTEAKTRYVKVTGEKEFLLESIEYEVDEMRSYGVSVHSEANVKDGEKHALGPPDGKFAKMEKENAWMIIDLGANAKLGTQIEFRIASDKKNENKSGTIQASTSPNFSGTAQTVTATTNAPSSKTVSIPVNEVGLRYVKVTGEKEFLIEYVSYIPADPCDAAASGNVDTDGDGISDICDKDDDNDGILDIDEGCGPGGGNGNIDIIAAFGTDDKIESENDGTYTTTISELYAAYTFNQEKDARISTENLTGIGKQGPIFKFYGKKKKSSFIDIVFSRTISGAYFKLTDFDENEELVVEVYDQNNKLINIEAAGYATLGSNVEMNGNVFTEKGIEDEAYGDNISNDDYGAVIFDFAGQLISRIKVSMRHNKESSIRFTEIRNFCLPLDTDGDGIPDSLDTDSDGDGCWDAIEGDGSFTDDSVDGNGRFTGGIDVNGVPTAVNGGQGIGDSKDATILGVGCSNCPMVPGKNTIYGGVFNDVNENGILDETDTYDLDGVTVYLYEDSNANGVLDDGVIPIMITTTVNGNYSFEIDPPVGSTVQSLSVRIASGSDDAEEKIQDYSMYINSTDLEFVYDNYVGGDQIVGMRFNNIAIPQGANITNAYIEFTVDETDSGSTNLIFSGHDVDHSPTFTSENRNISDRQKTSSVVNWSNVPAWNTAKDKHHTPDLQSIIQEIVNRHGWVSNNSMVIMVEGSGERTAEAYEGDAANAPLLVIEYTENGTPDYPKKYIVTIDKATLPEGYSLTNDNTQTATFIALNQSDCDNDFGYVLPGIITGLVYSDENGDGSQNGTETGFSAPVTVFADLDGSGILDTGEPTATTAADGSFSIVNVPVGSVNILIDINTLPAGLVLTEGNQPTNVTVTAGSAVSIGKIGYTNPLVANNDTYTVTYQNGIDGITISGVLDNDTLSGISIDPAEVTFTFTPTGPLKIDSDTGAITVARGTKPGTYTIAYTICQTTLPNSCDSATATVIVEKRNLLITNPHIYQRMMNYYP
ncbi:hypothetical protein [Arenibacter certesii]|uniref:SD-repeat containing protein B domain-containing protein n=1 Tax=Arenibacter certesii TaxID=228955 RepID=A0A918J4W5_9FLAO|nr:hypothetical protein [Arenibacter certesii]GGW48573.1 hypothetical protein GCM10007383_35830 [Arenibacter certesii]